MTLLLIIGVILLIAGNAFFVAAEFGLVSARRSDIELKAEAGSRAARITLGGMERVSVMLAAAQLGITLCSLGLGAIGEPLIAHALDAPLHALGVPDVLLHPIAITIALLIMTYLHVVFGEMIPKNLALAQADKVALKLTPPLILVVKILYPAIMLLNGIANLTLRALGIKPQDEVASAFTLDEVAGFVEESHREGLLSPDERQLIKGSLEFDETTVSSLVIPLENLTTARKTMTPDQIEQVIVQTGFSRLPIAQANGKLIGYVHLKDLLDVDDANKRTPLKAHEIRPLPQIAAHDSLQDALRIMKHAGAHMGQVVNSRKRVLGVVMLEDTLEELVGKIRDTANRDTK